ncbi:MAG TPA: hypothetical protein VFR27_13640 [Mycobacterium sp.]|nr:hypothetical protein [Mycobacterium sp.]
MQHSRQDLESDRLGQEDDQVRAAIRFAAVVTVSGVAFLLLAALWVSTCQGATVDTAACGLPQRTVLALGAPAILLGGGLWAFTRTYRVWRDHGTWWGWQGAGWFLLTLMLIALMMGVPAILGPLLAV